MQEERDWGETRPEAQVMIPMGGDAGLQGSSGGDRGGEQ